MNSRGARTQRRALERAERKARLQAAERFRRAEKAKLRKIKDEGS